MQKSKLVVALGAAAALAVTPLAASTAFAADGAGTNSGTAATYGAAASSDSLAKACKQVAQPKGKYLKTKMVDLSGLADFTQVTEQDGVKFSPTLEKRSVPGSWSTWGSPPDTETATPNILYTVGATSITVTLPGKGAKKGMAGMEVGPNPFAIHTFTADFQNKKGKSICTATVDSNGDAGTKLLAASNAKGAKKIVVSTDVDFSVANVRFK